ncbi:unnamed protein product [Porites lobata]|uniref:G-protein coupled receptors family 1 profile domain-containing protein n=1 Tax=Porites lobata TaxID=104759 RepID=A0ABN8NMF0_9CNID|nr:unnamed protein product [Porites lobata]
MGIAENEEDTRSPLEVTMHTVILALTTFFSLAGNSLVCLALHRNRRLRTTINFYVLSLAVADIILAVFFPFHLAASWLRGWPFGFIFCQFVGFLVQFWAQVSLSILTLASINRYVCVLKPLKYPVFFDKKKTVLSIISVWLFTLLQTLCLTIATPVTFRWSPKHLYCQGTSPDERTERAIYIFFGCFFTVPMLLVIFCYGSIYRVVKKHNTTIVPALQSTNYLRTISAQEIKTSRVTISPVAQWVFVEITTFSSWINPIIYGVMNRSMCREFRNIVSWRTMHYGPAAILVPNVPSGQALRQDQLEKITTNKEKETNKHSNTHKQVR